MSTWELFESKVNEMGAIAEAFVEGEVKRSPSAQYRVDPRASLDVVPTHDQVLGGAANQVFLGCSFPADPAYRLDIQQAGLLAADGLRKRGVIGRFGVDFISVKEGDTWRTTRSRSICAKAVPLTRS